MSYRLAFTKQAQEDIDFHKKSGNKPVLKKHLYFSKNLLIILLQVPANQNP